MQRIEVKQTAGKTKREEQEEVIGSRWFETIGEVAEFLISKNSCFCRESRTNNAIFTSSNSRKRFEVIDTPGRLISAAIKARKTQTGRKIEEFIDRG